MTTSTSDGGAGSGPPRVLRFLAVTLGTALALFVAGSALIAIAQRFGVAVAVGLVGATFSTLAAHAAYRRWRA